MPGRRFAPLGLGEFHGEILPHAREVVDAQFLGVVGDAAVGQARQRPQFGDELVPLADDFVAGRYKLARETLEGGFIQDGAFEQRIAGPQRPRVSLQQRQVGGIRLRQERSTNRRRLRRRP